MRAQAEQSTAVETISEGQFQRLCDEIYRDRLEIYGFRPGTGHREALLWMLLGCLISLLSVTDEELQLLVDASSQDPYRDAVRKLLQNRIEPPFETEPLIEELLAGAESE